MEQTQRFYDFCVPYNKNEKVMRATLAELVDLGYKTIAIEQIYDHSKKETGKRGADSFPEPVNLQGWRTEFKDKLKILQRLTILYIDGTITHAMNSSMNLRKYNLIAGQPKTEAALTHCCSTFNGDIVTFDPSGFKPLLNRKTYLSASKRGLYFEIKYSYAITNSTYRKDMIKIAHNYNVKGKSRNVIFSSGATNPFELRSPYDVANLAYIFSLSEDQGKNAVDKSCRQLFLHAESRRIGKTIMFVKCAGPIVFSDSSDTEEDEEFDEVVSTNLKKQNSSDSAKVVDDDECISETPNKKIKLI